MGRLKEPSLVFLFRRKAERKLGVGAREASVDVEMARSEGSGAPLLGRYPAREHGGVVRLIPPLPDIYVRLIEAWVFGFCGDEQCSTLVGLRVGHLSTFDLRDGRA